MGIELLTRGLVLVLYLAVFLRAVYVVKGMSGNWTRKATLIIFMVVSLYWASFYTHLIVHQWDGLKVGSSLIAMWSRIGHVIAAVGMWTIISFLSLVAKEYSLIATGPVSE